MFRRRPTPDATARLGRRCEVRVAEAARTSEHHQGTRRQPAAASWPALAGTVLAQRYLTTWSAPGGRNAATHPLARQDPPRVGRCARRVGDFRMRETGIVDPHGNHGTFEGDSHRGLLERLPGANTATTKRSSPAVLLPSTTLLMVPTPNAVRVPRLPKRSFSSCGLSSSRRPTLSALRSMLSAPRDSTTPRRRSDLPTSWSPWSRNSGPSSIGFWPPSRPSWRCSSWPAVPARPAPQAIGIKGFLPAASAQPAMQAISITARERAVRITSNQRLPRGSTAWAGNDFMPRSVRGHVG